MGEPRHGLKAGRVVVLGGLLVLAGVAVFLASRGASTRRASPPATAAVLPPEPFRIVFPEGFTRAQMAERVAVVARIAAAERRGRPHLSSAGYLRASGPRVVPGFGSAKRPLEGFLFPALYDFLPATTNRQLVAAQLAAFRRTWRTLDLAYARSKNLTPYDVLTIASMVEREAQVPQERALVAAVIYNRLRARMPLGIDATIRYGLHIPPTESLTVSALRSDNPYNTRTRFGLPPTPIANPGLASLEAAAHPARVDYLYFVREPDHRHHYFTDNFQDFLAHERAYGY